MTNTQGISNIEAMLYRCQRALAFYAKDENWELYDGPIEKWEENELSGEMEKVTFWGKTSRVLEDTGAIAREALDIPERKIAAKKDMKMVFAVKVPNPVIKGTYVVSDPIFESRLDAEAEARRLTQLGRNLNPDRLPCRVEMFALAPNSANAPVTPEEEG